MRHNKSYTKLNRSRSHVKSLMSNIASSLILHDQIKTTVTKAKRLRPYIEPLVTKAKNQNLSSFRYLLSILKSRKVVRRLFEVAQRCKTRPGGYTRIMKAGYRYGDSAPMAYIEFVDHQLNFDQASSETSEELSIEESSSDLSTEK